MTDSLFSGENQFDAQVKLFAFYPTDQLLEAATRRMADLKGPIYTSGRLQRLADICAGVHVLPIEHWRPPVEAKVQPPVPPEKPRHWLVRWLSSIAWSYWGGLAVGFYLGSTWQW